MMIMTPLLAVLGGLLVWWLLARRNRESDPGAPTLIGNPHSNNPQPSNPLSSNPLPRHVHDRVLELLGQDRVIQAVKEVRQATGLGLAEAKRLVDAIRDGQLPAPHPGTVPGTVPSVYHSLADRARQLRTEGQEAQAIRLVCHETGMSIPEARDFVRSLRS